MTLITLRKIQLNYGSNILFNNLDLLINKGERICLVGRNGVGKSTLLKVLANEEAIDGGLIERRQSLRIALLAQDVPQNMTGKVEQIVASGAEVYAHLSEYQQLSLKLQNDNTPELLKKIQELQQIIDNLQGWQLSQKVSSALAKLGLAPDAEFEHLSGGLKRRVLLARALIQEPDILLLDEPTNHLDIEAIAWLEEFLLREALTILFITHDRMFLQKLATRIIELERGRLIDFSGDYQTYLIKREALLEAEARQEALFDKKLAQEEIWIRQGIKARRTRNEGRVRALKQMREVYQARRQQIAKVNMQVQAAERSGKLVVEAQQLSYKYNSHALISDFSTRVLSGDKIGIIGPNGAGKTTLLKLLLGELVPRSGSIKQGTHLKIAYFDQLRAQLDDSKTILENVSGGSDFVTINQKTIHIISYLQDFLFTPERARCPISYLSGGERNRLLLAKLFAQPFNVLVMDEPTNDLDVETLELLEEILLEYQGTLFLVSHDRVFLNHVVTSTMVFEGDGKIIEYVGGYDDWLRQRPVVSSQQISSKPKAVEPKSKPKVQKLSYKEKTELQNLPKLIEQFEAEQAQLQAQMVDAAFYKQTSEQIVKVKARLAELSQQIECAYQRWEELENQV